MLFSNPKEEWTPFRWIRYKLTGDPLKPHERNQLEMFERTWEDIDDVPLGRNHLRITDKWSYWSQIDRRYEK